MLCLIIQAFQLRGNVCLKDNIKDAKYYIILYLLNDIDRKRLNDVLALLVMMLCPADTNTKKYTLF